MAYCRAERLRGRRGAGGEVPWLCGRGGGEPRAKRPHTEPAIRYPSATVRSWRDPPRQPGIAPAGANLEVACALLDMWSARKPRPSVFAARSGEEPARSRPGGGLWRASTCVQFRVLGRVLPGRRVTFDDPLEYERLKLGVLGATIWR